MSEFGKLKDEAGKDVKEHPEQAEKAEQAIDEKTGVIIADDEAAKRDQGAPPQDEGAGQSQAG